MDKTTYDTEVNSVMQQAMMFVNMGAEILWIVASLWRQYLNKYLKVLQCSLQNVSSQV